MRRVRPLLPPFLLPLLLLAAACGPRIVIADLDRLESNLELTPAQRPAWEAFRKEAEAAGSARAAWRLQLAEAASGERFDARRAHGAADLARHDAGRLIEAYARLDAGLTPAQRALVRSQLAPE
jgi:hypothetical protein